MEGEGGPSNHAINYIRDIIPLPCSYHYGNILKTSHEGDKMLSCILPGWFISFPYMIARYSGVKFIYNRQCRVGNRLCFIAGAENVTANPFLFTRTILLAQPQQRVQCFLKFLVGLYSSPQRIDLFPGASICSRAV